MNQPKQIIYPINYFKYFKSFFISPKDHELKLINKLKIKFKIKKNIKFLGRARAGIYLAAKISLKYSKSNIILLSPFTIPEVISLVVKAGAKPIFLDNERNSTNLKISELIQEIKKSPAALVITHYHINQKDYEKIHKLCKKFKTILIEDCAISYTGKSNNSKIGTLSDFSIYSFSTFKFINFFYAGAIAYNKKFSKEIYKETLNWIKLSPVNYFSKFLATIKFDILTNKYVFNFITIYLLKFLAKRNLDILDKKKYLSETFKLDKTYFSKPANIALNEIYNKIKNYNVELRHRQKIARIYFKYLKNITVPKYKSDELIIKDNAFLHYLIIGNSQSHRNELKKKLLIRGYDVGKFFYRDCSKMKNFKKYENSNKILNVNNLEKKIITLPTHLRISINYAKNLARNVRELY